MESALTWKECEPYQTTVNRLAREYAGRSGSEYDDLVQEGWESVVTYLQEGSQPTEESIERWVRSHLRQLERLHKGDATSPLVFGGTPSKPVEQMHIRDAIKSLPPELGTVAVMHGFGFTNIEIGEALGVHRTTVSVWLSDARIRLRRELG